MKSLITKNQFHNENSETIVSQSSQFMQIILKYYLPQSMFVEEVLMASLGVGVVVGGEAEDVEG